MSIQSAGDEGWAPKPGSQVPFLCLGFEPSFGSLGFEGGMIVNAANRNSEPLVSPHIQACQLTFFTHTDDTGFSGACWSISSIRMRAMPLSRFKSESTGIDPH
uniref:Uncharacterized protein n=1 Tax=Pseudomonas fluorescens (strain SBW25) TaxID=216595 RepID=A0A0G4E5A6_PSEFS|nr:hypothetical protein PQBR57_0235 [Pseudomonas fluorescens SBW25]